MQFMRRTFLLLFGAVLPLLLFATAFDFGVFHVVGTPAPVKKTLSDSGIYNTVVSQALGQAKTSSGNDGVSFLDPVIKSSAEESFSPQVIQSSSEKVIDGIYNWLGGKSDQPDFHIDLSGTKNDFAEKVGAATKAKAEKLPVCTSIPTTTDPLKATCLPPGVTPTQAGEQAKNEVLNAKGFLEHPDITASSIKSADGQNVFQTGKLKKAPSYYQLSTKVPYILATLTLVAILAVVFLSSSRRKGLRHAGFTVALVGAFMLAFAWGFNRAVTQNVIPQINSDNKVFESSIRILASDVSHSIDQNYWIFGIAYFSLGLVLVLVTFLGRKGTGKKAATPAMSEQSTEHNAQPKATPKPTQRPSSKPPTKRPPMIQG
jgi:protein-S-isoprenylcysteine O-methyltransferase Ste14